ncbi:MAG: 2'-5' RNA ligase family protein [Bifidobacteriaceae bacterium]|jgi:2'-5' RNA ligase|nr:2'-5' RNA ligase family protein [Bifidobacteriaceae bacterium]
MSLPALGPDQIYVGVAIMVPQPLAAPLAAARRGFGDPEAEVIGPHITVVPPMAVRADAVGQVAAHVASVAAAGSPFTIELRGSGTFRPVSPVVFVRVEGGATQCENLERALKQGPLAAPARFAYRPHLTIASEVDNAVLDRAQKAYAAYEASFRATHLRLCSMRTGQRWRQVGEYAL